MIIPIRCMSCGKTIADKWRYYQEEVKKRKKNETLERYYFDGNNIPITPEKEVLDLLNLKRPCCRKHFLTQIDLIDKI
jgi:DNA-directed RNA polymerase I, II, and III subunit RPABC5